MRIKEYNKFKKRESLPYQPLDTTGAYALGFPKAFPVQDYLLVALQPFPHGLDHVAEVLFNPIAVYRI
jgi:hypothetical protein